MKPDAQNNGGVGWRRMSFQPREKMPSAEAQLLNVLLEKFAATQDTLLPILHAVQHALNHIPKAAVPLIADKLNLSRAEVHGVISFYPDFHETPTGEHLLKICRAEACQARGGRALEAHALQKLGASWGETTADNRYTVEAVYCLGHCATGPNVMIDDVPHSHVDATRFDALIGSANITENTQPTNAAALTIYVPQDSTAVACGANDVAAAFTASSNITLKRNGSRGMCWLEPMVELETANGRVAFGPIQSGDVANLLQAMRGNYAEHPRYLGRTEEIPYLKNQQRLTFARVGITVPTALDEYCALGGFAGLVKALTMTAQDIVATVTDSGLRGRGGAAFPTGIKWATVLNTPATHKYIVCNADEGDSGTFADRMLMEGDPFVLIEGMTTAGIAVGASKGYIYCRSEYPHAIAMLNTAIAIAKEKNYLGNNLLGSAHSFDIEVRVGAGAYICGEETSLLESLEGKRGTVRSKPPLPAISGLFGKPTVVNNVVSLCSVPIILSKGAAYYRDFGMGKSRGTLPFQLAGNVKQGGLIECAFGLTLRELIEDYGGGTDSGRPIRAVQVGGPLGAYLPADKLDTPLDYETFTAMNAMIGHGGVVVFDDTVDMHQQAKFAMEFCAIESCGKCTPCRIGSTRGAEVIDRILTDENPARQIALLRDLCDTMLAGSLCALGGMAPYPVLSALEYFPEDFDRTHR